MKEKQKGLRKAGSLIVYLDLGARLAVSILVGIYAGNWLDGALSTQPVFLLLGAFLGTAAGIYSIYRAAFPDHNKADKAD